MHDAELVTLAHQVRARIVECTKKTMYFNVDLQGACAISSVIFATELRQHGIDSEIVVGHFPDFFGQHVWVYVPSFCVCVDLTASQFISAYARGVYILENEIDSGLLIARLDHRFFKQFQNYEVHKFDDDYLEFFSKWDPSQQPSVYNCQQLYSQQWITTQTPM